MKAKLLLSFLLLFVIRQGMAQQEHKFLEIFPVVDNDICYTEVIQMKDISKDELYTRAHTWFVNAFKSAKDVIQMQDKEAGKIMGKGAFQCSIGALLPALDMTVTITIIAKDGRYKYILNNFIRHYSVSMDLNSTSGDQNIFEMFEGADPNKKVVQKNATKLNESILNLVESLEKGMNIPSSGSTKNDDNW